ncbi:MULTISPECIES: cupin domain-containing protein [unclassified Acinetobacter]|uniref:Cupin domain-containing protein n=1 Tax=Acinetobacter corruptisaponis TaxID=3045147 RepID=A0ABY8S5L0_9GAMM|nr:MULTISPECIES: cupin domain-containing protein [unclassified Acinetobacter]MDH0030442.1 cupin domain-containing protein [Acinetobacter sp. GD04021]MDH0885669.1 cupin domain-containing protein [Acinetobacter sp. GD03873]MDH1082015.1 cupin domain-containing protein [Acinetobacter sp. GD03983]MDH2188955.1 cupin domain-containing protein [Acinetobacter sp. GD03645]MDH2202484.1 cupin domain-containing protein [Acinetobacter sp. GD03647]
MTSPINSQAILLSYSNLNIDEASIDYPRPDRLVKGNPERLTYSLYEHPHMSCGIWQCEVGAWNIVFADNKQEFFQVIEGTVRIHDAQTDTFIEVAAGNAGIIPPAFIGTFEVLEAVKKYYVIVEV